MKLPVLTVVLYGVTLGYGLGWNVDIRKMAMLIVGGVFLAMGSFLPGLDYVKNRNMSREKAKKINRFVGFASVVMGLLSIVTIFLPPVSTGVWLVLLILYAVVTIVYGFVVEKPLKRQKNQKK